MILTAVDLFCVDGLLLEGLVDLFECTPVEKIDKTALSSDNVGDLNKGIVCGSQFCVMRIPEIKTGPVFINEIGISSMQTVISDNVICNFYGTGETDEITVVGATSITKGYPV